jgi:insertion element IS1 protein InsB
VTVISGTPLMVLAPLYCPTCYSTDVVKHGKTSDGKQRFRCRNPDCAQQTFLTTYAYKGRLAEVKQQIIDMAVNGSDIHDTARVLYISPITVLDTLRKKEPAIQDVNEGVWSQESADFWHVVVQKVDTAEMDKMWSVVRKKEQQRWLWHAIDHQSGAVLAYVLGTHADTVFVQLKQLLAPFGISRFYTDDGGTYQRHLNPEQHEIGKANTQKIERKHLTLRTRIKRLARKTLCFSKSVRLHDSGIGLFVNRYEFGLQI